VLLRHGGRDKAVPFGHGLWLASRIFDGGAWFFDGGGHSLRKIT
jgi:hypothetical protein